MREQFRDAAGLLGTYVFEVNHSEEQAPDQGRSIDHQAVTTGPRFVIQQGTSNPLTLKFSGTILTQAQLDAMQSYYDACSTRTVFFRDFTGVEFEVIVTRFDYLRKRTLSNPRAPLLKHYWTYDLEMEVIP